MTDGLPIFDLLRFGRSARVSDAALRTEVEAHCRMLECSPQDATSYLLAALGVIGGNLEHFPHHAYVRMSEIAFGLLSRVMSATVVR